MQAGMERLSCAGVLGSEFVEAAARAGKFLRERSDAELLKLVGRVEPALRLQRPRAGKQFFPASYGGGGPCDGDLLAARGVFYVTEAGKIMLDCTAGHYQMTWGYGHPELDAAAAEAMRLGVVWDNHSNIPSQPVKMLSERLIRLVEGTGLDRTLLGVCTGSIACAAALKIMLARYAADPGRAKLGPPVVIALTGNYHGTDMVAQTLRGMWPGLVAGMEAVQVEPNDVAALEEAFARYGRRVAGFWAEPVMMNREAILVDAGYLQRARELCDHVGALMAIDEIQTGFWQPEVLFFRTLGIRPDFVVVGKGMTAGFHPLAALLYRSELDVLQQYDAISTNGNASLAAFIALCNLRLIERDRERVARLARQCHDGIAALVREFPALLECATGAGCLTGLRFNTRDDALGFHKAAVERGLWLRAHTYYPGHRTVLTKLALNASECVMDYMLERFRDLLRRRA